MKRHQCNMSLRCKSEKCGHARPHKPDFQPHVKCIPVEDVKPPEDCPDCGAKGQKGHHPHDCFNHRLSKARGELIRMAAEILKYPNMPSMHHEEWGFTKGMQITNWRKVYDASDKAQGQCRRWAIKLRSMADNL